MRQRRYEFILRAEQPIAHHAESFGNTAIAMRRKLRLESGDFVQVPIITADTMRHQMREAASLAFLDAAGILVEGSLTESALRLLFSGGMITGKGDAATVKLDEDRELRDLFPHLSLMGGCAGNRCLAGRLQASDATLICDETLATMPEWVKRRLATVQHASHRDHVEEVQRVRMDPCLVPERRLLLSGIARDSVEQRLLASAQASEREDHRLADESKSTMMPRRFERIVEGSLFYWHCQATTYTDLDDDTFDLTVAAALYDLRAGGKRGTGHGHLRAVACEVGDLARPSEARQEIDPTAVATPKGRLFVEHVRERSEKIKRALASVNA